MTVQFITNNRLNRTEQLPLTLRDGQVVLGKVTKLYPNNRAEIQIGSHRIIAQIEVPLTVNEQYVLKVEQKEDNLIHFKVLQSNFNINKKDPIATILQRLHIPITKVSLSLMEGLIREQIPFNRNQFIQALRLIENTSSSGTAPSIVKDMIVNRQPLTMNYLQAMIHFHNKEISPLLEKVLNEIKGLPNSKHKILLQQQINNLRPASPTERLAGLTTKQLQALLQTLTLFNYSSTSKQLITSSQATLYPTDEMFLTIFSDLKEKVSNPTFRDRLFHLLENFSAIKTESNRLLGAFPKISEGQIEGSNHRKLVGQLQEHLMQLLPKEEKTIIQRLLQNNTNVNNRFLHSLLQTFSSDSFYSLLLEALTSTVDPNKSDHEPIIQQRFLFHLQQMLHSSGITNEAIMHAAKDSFHEQLPMLNQSLKTLLFQFINNESTSLEHSKQLLHFLHGLQLQTKEMNNIIQTQLQFPGYKLDLPTDLRIQFEGRRTEKGQIDTNHCRILFFLHLHNIDETIIDMNVQKRVITLTIYNDYENRLEKLAPPLRKLLHHQLEKLNYHLSTVRMKPLQSHFSKEISQSKTDTDFIEEQEGFDFLI